MEYLVPIIIAVIAISVVVVAVVYVLRKRRSRTDSNIGITEQDVPMSTAIAESTESNDLIIPIELLPATVQIDESRLVEITNRSVVARITQTLPVVAEIATRTLTANATNVALQQTAKAANVAVQNANKVLQGGDIYRVVLSPGAKLVNSRNMEGAFRGFARGAKNIRESANLVPGAAQKAGEVVPATVAKGAKVANVAAIKHH